MKVLVAIDSSTGSARVLGEMAARPWPEGTVFCVAHVVDLQRWARLPVLVEDAKREGHRIVEAGVERLTSTGHRAFSELILGYPRRAISEYGKEWQADLIVAGSHGHGAIGRFLLGSVAQGILRTALCSVEIVRRKTDVPASAHGMKILVATDGSDCSVGAVHSVATRPWPDGTLVRVLSVEEWMAVDNQMNAASSSAIYPAALIEELMQSSRDRANAAVQTATEILQRAGVKVADGDATPLGEPRGVILDTAAAWKADLIVLGSHGRSGLDRLLLGSVSESVAVHADCSVEVIGK